MAARRPGGRSGGAMGQAGPAGRTAVPTSGSPGDVRAPQAADPAGASPTRLSPPARPLPSVGEALRRRRARVTSDNLPVAVAADPDVGQHEGRVPWLAGDRRHLAEPRPHDGCVAEDLDPHALVPE